MAMLTVEFTRVASPILNGGPALLQQPSPDRDRRLESWTSGRPVVGNGGQHACAPRRLSGGTTPRGGTGRSTVTHGDDNDEMT